MNPYLSIVMAIGGDISNDLINRFTESTSNTFSLSRKFGLDAEIVVVVWNHPCLKFESQESWIGCPIRIIQTGDLHSQISNPYGFRFREMQAKNIGIRRARGEFVLSTNPDDLFSPEMIGFFAQHALLHGLFYRANRHDTRDGKVFRICYPTGGHSVDETIDQIKRPSSPLAAPWHEDMLHFSAAGDFTLMSRDDWFMIHGNPERDYNNSVDGQTIWLAHTKGLKQVLLPYPIYHPDHSRTLNFSHTNKGYFSPHWDDNKPFTKENGEEWGFAGMEFEETTL